MKPESEFKYNLDSLRAAYYVLVQTRQFVSSEYAVELAALLRALDTIRKLRGGRDE